MGVRKLLRFNITSNDAYIFEWQKENDQQALETFSFRGKEPPRPELKAAAKNVAMLAAKMVGLSVTDSEKNAGAYFLGVKFSYPETNDRYRLRIHASQAIQSGYDFVYTTPKWNVYYSNAKGEMNNTIRTTIHTLLEECWKYIDGERAQTKLPFKQQEEGDGHDS